MVFIALAEDFLIRQGESMKIGDKVRASYPYGGVPACEGEIVKKLDLGAKKPQFLVNFEVRPKVYKSFYLTERELTAIKAG